jgi:hypothetical protein
MSQSKLFYVLVYRNCLFGKYTQIHTEPKHLLQLRIDTLVAKLYAGEPPISLELSDDFLMLIYFQSSNFQLIALKPIIM